MAGWALVVLALLTLAAASPFINLTVTESGVLRAQGTNLFSANSNSLNASVNLSSRSATGHTHTLSAVTDAGTAASRNVPASGDAATNQVVLGSDTRLTDARAPISHVHSATGITSGVLSVDRLGTGTPNSSNFLRGDGAFAQVGTNDIPGLVAALASGGSSGTKTIFRWNAEQGFQPSSDPATFATRNTLGVMEFAPSIQEAIRFRGVVPEAVTATTATVILKWTTSATSGDARWGVKFWALTGDTDGDSFATAVEGTTTTSGTAGTIMTTTLSAVGLDSAAAGDGVVLEVYRDVGDSADTINGNDLQLHSVEVRTE